MTAGRQAAAPAPAIAVRPPPLVGPAGVTATPAPAYILGALPYQANRNPPPYQSRASDICADGLFLEGGSFPAWQWEPAAGPDYPSHDVYPSDPQEYQDGTGVSGWVLHPHLSDQDVPFSHPFGTDFLYYIAPDPPFDPPAPGAGDLAHPGLLSPGNRPPYGADSTEGYATAYRQAQDLGLAASGVLGVETDRGLIPEAYRPAASDRVVTFGRWIVDCRHTDYHTEIHPPLLTASARVLPADAATEVKVIARPFLVSQDFGGGLYDYLVGQVAAMLASDTPPPRLEAHPALLPPFRGQQAMTFIVQPPAPPAGDPSGYELRVSCDFTVQPGVSVAVVRDGANPRQLRVTVTMDEASYASGPPGTGTVVPESILSLAEGAEISPELRATVAAVIETLRGVTVRTGAAVDPEHIYTTMYPPLRTASSVDGTRRVTDMPIDRLPEPTPFAVTPLTSDGRAEQPFPIYGTLTLRWAPTPE